MPNIENDIRTNQNVGKSYRQLRRIISDYLTANSSNPKILLKKPRGPTRNQLHPMCFDVYKVLDLNTYIQEKIKCLDQAPYTHRMPLILAQAPLVVFKLFEQLGSTVQ